MRSPCPCSEPDQRWPRNLRRVASSERRKSFSRLACRPACRGWSSPWRLDDASPWSFRWNEIRTYLDRRERRVQIAHASRHLYAFLRSTDCIRPRRMAQPEVVQLYKLIERLDELCREASAIRDELRRAAGQHATWPNLTPVVSPDTKSLIPVDFFPTSTDESATN